MQEAQGEQPQTEQQQRQECSAAADRPHESDPAAEEAGTSAADGGGRGFAARRPGWQLPSLHEGLQLESDEVLTQFKGRQPCPKCQRSRHLYCYDCLVSLTPTPKVPLPFKFSIITHSEEIASKNTGVHAAILCPGMIDLHDVDHCPEMDPSRTVVLFPSDDALEVSQLEADSIDRAIIIDSKWQKAKLLVQQPCFEGMRRVKLSNTRSAFWRFHTKGVSDEGVCTIEAMFFFLKALAEQGKLSDPKFGGQHSFDNLLWYFAYQHKVLQQVAASKANKGTDDQHKKQQQNAKQQSGSPSGQAAKRQKTDDDPPSQCL